MKIVFAAIPAHGHLYPLMPLALACYAAGHEVTVAVGAPFLGRLPLPTIPQQPTEMGLDAGFAEAERRDPGLHGRELAVRFFADVMAEAVTEVSFGAVEVLNRAIHEIASLDLDLLVAVGPDGDPTALADVPEHVHVEKFVDQSRVLPLVDVIVHHGGTGSVLGALATGLPQLILPQGADQFFNATFLTEAGAARALRNDEHRPGEIRRAVSELLTGGAEQTVARQIQAEIAELPTPSDVMPKLVALTDR